MTSHLACFVALTFKSFYVEGHISILLGAWKFIQPVKMSFSNFHWSP